MNDQWRDLSLSDSELCLTLIDAFGKAPAILSIMSVPDYRVLYLNRPTESIPALSDTPGDAVSRYAAELVPGWEEKLLPYYEQVRTTGLPLQFRDYRWESECGVSYWDLTIIPSRGQRTGVVECIATLAVEVTERFRVLEELIANRELLHAVQNSLSAHIAVVDRGGTIISINEPWRRFARENGDPTLEHTGIGVNYLDVCRRATGPFSEGAKEALQGLEDALSGSVREFELEYICPTPSEERWFLLRVTPLADGPGGAVTAHIDITRLKRTEDALRESESKYRSLVEMMNEGLARTDGDYCFTFVNPAFAGMLGYSPEEMVGRKLMDFVREDRRELMAEQISRRKRGETTPYEQAWRAKDGGTVHTQVSPRPLYDDSGSFIGSVAVVTDITDRRRAEEALKASEANYREIFDSVNDTIFVHDVETGDILDANCRAEEMYGYTVEELRRLSVGDISSGMPPYTQEEAVRCIRTAAKGSSQLTEWQGRTKSGRVFWEEVNLKRAVIGGTARVLALVRDISERKLTEDRLLQEERLRTEFYRRTILAATEGKLAILEKSDIERIAGPILASWHVTSPEAQSLVRHDATEIAQREGMEKGRISNFEVCIGEATTNAIKHAGGGEASLHRQAGGLLFAITDRGPGIEALSLPDVALTRGYSTAGTLGMGYTLMIAAADRVYLATGPQGTTVGIEMKLQAPTSPMQDPFPGLLGRL